MYLYSLKKHALEVVKYKNIVVQNLLNLLWGHAFALWAVPDLGATKGTDLLFLK